MKLATTTGDFDAYTTQAEALRHIRNAGFRYADYNFGKDYRMKNGIYSENFGNYFDEILQTADSVGIKLV